MLRRYWTWGLLALAACNGSDDKSDSDTWSPDDLSDSESDTETAASETETATETETQASDTDTEETDTETETDTECPEYLDYYLDSDGDGAGDPSLSETFCAGDNPPYYVDNAWDCDDDDRSEPTWVEAGATGSTGTAADPFGTVQEGVDAAVSCVLVTPGTYVEDVDLNGQSVWLYGGDGAAATILQGTGAGPVLTVASGETIDTLVQGLTLTGGAGAVVSDGASSQLMGCGAYVDGADPAFIDVRFTDNTCTGGVGGGLAVNDGDVLLESVVFAENQADAGAGLYVGDDGDVDGLWVVVRDNQATTGGGAWVQGELAMDNSLFCGNSAEDGGALSVEDRASFDFVTVVDNTSATGQLSVDGGAGLELWSSTVSGNTDGLEVYDSDGGASLYYSNTWPSGWSGAGSANQSVDPDFSNATGDCSTADFSLASTSPLVDAGDPTATDPDGTTADAGSYGGPYGSW